VDLQFSLEAEVRGEGLALRIAHLWAQRAYVPADEVFTSSPPLFVASESIAGDNEQDGISPSLFLASESSGDNEEWYTGLSPTLVTKEQDNGFFADLQFPLSPASSDTADQELSLDEFLVGIQNLMWVVEKRALSGY